MLIKDPVTKKSEPLDFQKGNYTWKQERLKLHQLLDDSYKVCVYVHVYLNCSYSFEEFTILSWRIPWTEPNHVTANGMENDKHFHSS